MSPIVFTAIVFVVIILTWIIIAYNRFVKLRNRIDESFSTMDVYLKKRWDLVPNLIETVKGYMKHENSTLKEIVKLRKGDYDEMSEDEKIKNNSKLSSSLGKLFALAEDYPELKSSENFKELNKQLEKIEDDIANSRKYYNGTVREYNDLTQIIPNNIIAKIFGFKKQRMFGIEETERKNVKVEF